MFNPQFWKGKKVFITGHMGFKGSWLCLWLNSLGAHITGYSLAPPSPPTLYDICRIDSFVRSVNGDICDGDALLEAVREAEPEIVIHLAAQPLVRNSFRMPVETYAINVMGTVNLLEAVRSSKTVKAVVNITTDKCYENREWVWGYREIDALGGYDPYASSKACSELVTASYRSSFFNPKDYKTHNVGIATARAGNVIGGGDWAADRLIPDCIKALLEKKTIRIRNPHAIRPWQHVLEPLRGYLILAQKLYQDGSRYSEAWNFGPSDADSRAVEWIVKKLCLLWGGGASYEIEKGESGHLHEAHYLKLDCSKSMAELKWRRIWELEKALDRIVTWARYYEKGSDMTAVCEKEIQDYTQSIMKAVE